MKKKKPKLTEEAYILKADRDCFVFSSLSAARAFTKSRAPGWPNSKVVKVKIIEQ